MLHAVAVLTLATSFGSSDRVELDPIHTILDAFAEYRVVAIGENHGHAELHDLLLELLADPRAPDQIDDVAVEWGNALYQGVVDRYVGGEEVPWDSVTMAWRNTVVSPNTVWDAPVYADFFRGVRQLNAGLEPADRYRVLLADSPVEWAQVDSVADLRPFFDRAASMAEVIQRESLRLGRRALFVAGGLHVAKRPRSRPNSIGVPIGEITPIAWLELRHPGATWVVQSIGSASRLGLPALVGAGDVQLLTLDRETGPGRIEANRTTTLRNRDGTRPDVYRDLRLADIVDAVLVWDPEEVTIVDPDPATYRDEGYWQELDRRSRMLRGQPMDPALRGGGAPRPSPEPLEHPAVPILPHVVPPEDHPVHRHPDSGGQRLHRGQRTAEVEEPVR